MLIELAVGMAAAVVVSALARAVVQRRQRLVALPPPEPPKQDDRALEVGDVLLYLDESLWLAGVLELDEGADPLRLFTTPESQRASWVCDVVGERGLLFLRESSDLPDGPMPERLPLEGRILRLAQRGRGVVRARGEHLPESRDRASYTLLADVGGRVALVVDFEDGPRLALVGDRIERRLVERLPGERPER